MALVKKVIEPTDFPHDYMGLSTDLTDTPSSGVPDWSTFIVHDGSAITTIYISNGSTWIEV